MFTLLNAIILAFVAWFLPTFTGGMPALLIRDAKTAEKWAHAGFIVGMLVAMDLMALSIQLAALPVFHGIIITVAFGSNLIATWFIRRAVRHHYAEARNVALARVCGQ